MMAKIIFGGVSIYFRGNIVGELIHMSENIAWIDYDTVHFGIFALLFWTTLKLEGEYTSNYKLAKKLYTMGYNVLIISPLK